ncbi:MAG: hypothetical protein ABJF88_07225 [Rhodothermales bacterium]
MLLLPLIAMQFTDEVDWTGSDFVFAAVLLFGSLGLFELAVRKSGDAAYRAGAGVALAAVFLLVWVNGAVGLTDSAADVLFFLLVPAVAIVGALLARFQPRGMARAMFATALVLTSVAVAALVAGIVPAYNSTFEILGIAGFFAALFVGSGLLFREAAREKPERGAV